MIIYCILQSVWIRREFVRNDNNEFECVHFVKWYSMKDVVPVVDARPGIRRVFFFLVYPAHDAVGVVCANENSLNTHRFFGFQILLIVDLKKKK